MIERRRFGKKRAITFLSFHTFVCTKSEGNLQTNVWKSSDYFVTPTASRGFKFYLENVWPSILNLQRLNISETEIIIRKLFVVYSNDSSQFKMAENICAKGLITFRSVQYFCIFLKCRETTLVWQKMWKIN